MKVLTELQIDEITPRIGQSKKEAAELKRALRNGETIFVFFSLKEVKKEPTISKKGRRFCKAQFDSGSDWAGWVEIKKAQPIPGFTPGSYIDTHGNARTPGNGGLNWTPSH